ncbi:protein NLP7-like isoform X2 [Andrographis paniculata]|nr:protein NLP7-like isoform X2 [Andrographis paniculata]XP_051148852.1 protein NLP7-like isoform X2 [Andrographis paniculata]XP_051148854.1 protein NLP7-like isoform X2 [Andrographis paniculata]XP_051148855.1 protein NLP7-like isoform X2 [Andrographis paniculata]XP_051148856.1 protein NLP7-like isoform X2 [Andrographis paniculata]XP_051148857.1 protein NLP7-like isoform X2 [Andrographis paniculata]
MVTESPIDGNNKEMLPSPFMGLVPLEHSDGSFIIKERLTQALRQLKDSTQQHVLAQVWAPVKNGGKYVLSTSGQPFVLDPNSNGLHQYRLISLMYKFNVDGDSTEGNLGLPGRVFRQKIPEWTPNVQYYSSKEFPRLNHALNYNVRGTLALPVFEPSGQSCVGVLELIMTAQKINYANEVDKVCKALEAVNLKSSEILTHQNIQPICNEGRQNALAEILEIITMVCETHTLPLAQTWVPCRHRSILTNCGGFNKTCSSFDGSCAGQVSMSTTDVAFYVVDAQIWGFREACAEHHLQKGQGVAGRAFASQSSCFCQDITKFCKIEYPLVHYARMFGLRSSFAICLQSNYTGNDNYVLEFFLPPNIKSYGDQHALLEALLLTMKRHFGSLRVASGEDLDHEWRFREVIKASINDELDLRPSFDLASPSKPDAFDGQATNKENIGDLNEVQIAVPKDAGKKLERKRGKAEKTIKLEVLQQYFAGSLKDAAKSLGVCPTTMKRICRQHGITRWPSRKINKVNRSLSKLKRVIESVQGGDGTFSLTSLAPSTIPVTVGPITWAPTSNKTNQHNDDKNEVAMSKSNPSQAGTGSREESIETPTSQGSCQGSPSCRIDTSPLNDPVEENNTSAAGAHKLALCRMLVEDAGSSHDLHKLCHPGEALFDVIKPEDRSANGSDKAEQFAARPEAKSITIKALYRDDIIRFRLPVDSTIVKIKEEVAKRLKLGMGTFDVKYLDDDHEWVLIACDADLLECIEISKSSGGSVARLLVHDIIADPGSSCASSGE